MLEKLRGAATRRGFLKVFAAAAMACVGGAASLSPFRKAFAGTPFWTTVPDQVWSVGVPVYLNLATYATDPDGDPLVFSLDRALPPGVTLNGSIISGTPTASFAAAQFTATADDLQDSDPPAPPNDLRPK